MARSARATISLDVKGRSRVRAALQGTTSDMRAAGASMSSASRSSAAVAVRADATRTQSAHRAAQAVVREAKAGERARVGGERAVAREAEKTARTQERIAQRMQRSAARQRVRDQQQQRQQRASGFASGASDVGGAMGIPTSLGAGATVAFGAMAALAKKLNDQVQAVVTAADRASGRLDRPEAGVNTIALDTRETRLAHAAFGALGDDEFNARLDAMKAKINEVAAATNTEPGALVDGLTMFQDRFSDLQFGIDSMESLARAANVTGVSFEELASLVGEMKGQGGMSGGDVQQFMALLAQQGLEGAVTPAQMARNFGAGIGQYQRQGGKSGIAGAREYGALAQAQMAGGGGAEEAATRMSEGMRVLSDSHTLDRLSEATGGRRGRGGRWRGGVDVRAIRAAGGGLPEILDAIHAAPQLRNAETMQRVFTDKQGREGVGIWAGQTEKIRRLTNASTGAGQAYIDTGARRIGATTGEQLRGAAIVENATVGRQAADEVDQSRKFMALDSALRQQGGIGALFSSDSNPFARPMFQARERMLAQSREGGLTGMDARAKIAGAEAIGSVAAPIMEWLREAITGTKTTPNSAPTPTRIAPGQSIALDSATVTAIGRAVAAASPDGPGPGPVVGPGLGARTPAQRRGAPR